MQGFQTFPGSELLLNMWVSQTPMPGNLLQEDELTFSPLRTRIIFYFSLISQYSIFSDVFGVPRGPLLDFFQNTQSLSLATCANNVNVI